MADIPNDALVFVGDGRKARFLRNRGTRNEVDLVVERVVELDNPPTREQGTDRPGRLHGSDGVSRSAIEETDWHHQAEQRFAADMADELYRMGHSQEFVTLIVVAPPKMLGDLRAALHPEVAKRIIAEVPKDLTAVAERDLVRLLS
jgi:protein required for attachment to host cells